MQPSSHDSIEYVRYSLNMNMHIEYVKRFYLYSEKIYFLNKFGDGKPLPHQNSTWEGEGWDGHVLHHEEWRHWV